MPFFDPFAIARIAIGALIALLGTSMLLKLGVRVYEELKWAESFY